MSTAAVLVRPEIAADREAIYRLNALAFQGSAEAELIDRLRDGGHVLCSLVAEQDGAVVGHILFSRLHVDTAAGVLDAAALAPMGVLPGHQRKGIGSALVRAGLAACRRAGETIVVVVGHQGFYPRFGFSAVPARQLSSPYGGDACMALELQPGALSGVHGAVRYALPFALLS